jgi:ribosomal protein S18 acetylase RimI-like enzyme
MSASPRSADAFHLRVATLSDSAAIAALVSQLGYLTTPPEMKGRLERLLTHPEHAIIVAEASGDVVGLVAAQVGHGLEFNGTYGRITGLVVDSHWRGRGVGRILMEHMESWCRDRGAHSLTLTSGNHRVEAHKFYERIGYSATGLRFIKRLLPSTTCC